MYALVISACVRSEAERPDNSISFAPVTEKVKKSIISGTEYPVAESFVVSAYYNGTTAYFENLTAAYSSSVNLWETSSSQYWPLAGSLDFIAYSPASASGVTIDATDGVVAQDYTIQDIGSMTTDLCTASANVPDCDVHPDSVPLTFSHALSQIVFRVKAAGYYSTASRTVELALSGLTLEGIYSVGTYSAGAWGGHDAEYSYVLSSDETALTYDGENNPETIDVCSYLFIPQTLGENAAVSVSFNMTQTVSGTDYTLENSPVTVSLGGSVTQWEPGKKYIYTLSIGMNNVITFTASTVGWTDDAEDIIVEEN